MLPGNVMIPFSHEDGRKLQSSWATLRVSFPVARSLPPVGKPEVNRFARDWTRPMLGGHSATCALPDDRGNLSRGDAAGTIAQSGSHQQQQQEGGGGGAVTLPVLLVRQHLPPQSLPWLHGGVGIFSVVPRPFKPDHVRGRQPLSRISSLGDVAFKCALAEFVKSCRRYHHHRRGFTASVVAVVPLPPPPPLQSGSPPPRSSGRCPGAVR
ncbi:unnamed protein product [Lampetra planeri]